MSVTNNGVPPHNHTNSAVNSGCPACVHLYGNRRLSGDDPTYKEWTP